MEEKLIIKKGFELEYIPAVKMKRSLIGIISFAFAYPLAVLKTVRVISRLKPNLLIATGGYVAGTAGIAACLNRIPVFLQEQNSIPGLASKLLNIIAVKTFIGFEDSARYFLRKRNIEFTGNPIRPEIGSLSRDEGCEIIGCSQETDNILIIGGSQGAKSINRAIENILNDLSDKKDNVQLIWQCGEGEKERLIGECRRIGIKAVVRSFFDRMDAVYAATDIAVCRGGAITLAELSKCGIPMIIIPYPYAAANHQYANALYYQKASAGIVIEDNETMTDKLRDTLVKLLESEGLREQMASASRRIGKNSATETIANSIKDFISR